MAIENISSASITNLDATPVVPVTTGMVLAVNTACEYFKVSATKWYAQLSA